VGQAIGQRLCSRRYTIGGVATRSLATARRAVQFIRGGQATRSAARAARSGDIVFITTPDDAILPVCEAVASARAFRKGAIVFHCSGGTSAEALASARDCGAHVASLHPLQSLPTPEEGVKRLKGTVFTFQGDAGAEPVAERLVRALGGTMVAIAADAKPLYHAASVVLSNYLAAVVDLGMALFERSGIPRDRAHEAAMPLVEGTVRNIRRLGLPDALTGPIARGDTKTVERHLAALAALPEHVGTLYRELGLHTVRVARRKGTLSAADARRLVAMLARG